MDANVTSALNGAADEKAMGVADRSDDAQGPTRAADTTSRLRAASGQTGTQDAEASGHVFAEGNVGLGMDIVEIARMQRILERTPSFARKVFSQAERDYCEGTANPAVHYALRFAAKEAVVKALGTGFSQGVWVNDIEVERAQGGRPSVKLSGRALEVAREQGVREVSISLSNTHTDAVACVMMLTESALQAKEKRADPMAELARQFKETRGMLDEL